MIVKMICKKYNCGKRVASKSAQLCSTHYDQDIFRIKKPFYRMWQSMKARCYSKNHESYYLYGARGIKVCDKWLASYENFERDILSLGKKPTPQHSLDRIDNNGNYELGNVRWATKKEQVDNRRPETKARKNNKIGIAGVRLHQGRWQARGKHGVHIGSYATKQEAIAARKQWEINNHI